MNESWIKKLKAGDKVFVNSNLGRSLATVQRITPTGRVVVNNTQFINGANLSNMWNILRLEEATEEAVKVYKIGVFVRGVFRKLRETKAMTYEQAKEINTILDLGVVE